MPLRLCGEFDSSAPPLDPEHRVAIVGLHGEAQLHLKFLRSPHKIENLLRLLRQAFEFARQPRQRLIEREELVSVFFEKLAPRVEREASFSRRQQREEELRPLPQASQRSRKRCRKHPVMLQRSLDIPRQIFHSQVAHRDSEVVPRHIFQFVRFIENHRRRFRQDARVGCAFGLQLDGEIGEEQMMIDDDNVALHPAPAHFGDEAALPLAALLPDARLRARIQFVPERAGFGKLGQFRAVAGRGRLLPRGNRAILLNLFQPAQARADQ